MITQVCCQAGDVAELAAIAAHKLTDRWLWRWLRWRSIRRLCRLSVAAGAVAPDTGLVIDVDDLVAINPPRWRPPLRRGPQALITAEGDRLPVC